MRGRPKRELTLQPGERRILDRLATGAEGDAIAQRARVVLRCADGHDNRRVAADVGIAEQTVSKWRHRFVTGRVRGLYDQARPGAPPKLRPSDVGRVVVTTLERHASQDPCSTRSLAQELGISQSAVSRIWQAFGLPPGRSGEARFAGEVHDVLGIVAEPPTLAAAVVTGKPPRAQGLRRRVEAVRAAEGDRAGATALEELLHTAARHDPADGGIYLVLSSAARDRRHAAALWRWLEVDTRRHLHYAPSDVAWRDLVDGWLSRLSGTPLGRGLGSDEPLVPTFARYLSLQRQRNQKPPASE